MKESESALALQSLRAAYALLLQDRDALRVQRDEWREMCERAARDENLNAVDLRDAREVIRQMSEEVYVLRKRVAYLSTSGGAE